MENVTFTTPSGYTVHMKPYLTFGDKRALERVFAEGMSVDPNNPGQMQASGKAVYEAQDKAVELMVVEIVMDGQSITGDKILKAIYAMRDDDGRAIYDKVNELSTPEKKGEQVALALFQFHRTGRGRIPNDYFPIYLCDLLNIPYTELEKQPAWWVERMIVWHTQRAKAQELAAKEAQRKAKR